MKQAAVRVFTLFTKDLKDAIRDARVLVALIVPLGIGVFYNFTFDDTAITTISGTVAISAAGDTQLPELISAVLADNVKISFVSQPDQAAVEAAVGTDDADVGIIVPANFDRDLHAGTQPELTLIRSPDASVAGDYVIAAIEPVVRGMAGQSSPVILNVSQATEISSDTVIDKIGIRTWSLAMAVILMLSMISALAIPIVLAEEFEKKTIDALVLAMPYHEVILAKMLLGMFYILVMIAIFITLTSLTVIHWATFAIAVGLTGMALLCFGLLLAGILKNANQLNTWSGIFLIPFFAPAAVVGSPAPDWVTSIAKLFPSGAGMKLLLNSVSKERLFDGDLRSILILVAWAAAAYALLLWQLKRRQA